MKVIHTPIAEISFNEAKKILHIKVHEGAEMNLRNTRIHYKKINELVENKDYFALVDASNYYTVEKTAWKYASSKRVVSNRKAIAHYNSSPANKLTTSVFRNMYKTLMPLKIFNTKDEAVKWLKSLSVGEKNNVKNR